MHPRNAQELRRIRLEQNHHIYIHFLETMKMHLNQSIVLFVSLKRSHESDMRGKSLK